MRLTVSDKKRRRVGEDKKRLALRTIDLEALADALARTSGWDDSVALAAAAFDESLRSLGVLDVESRRRLSLYALLAETVLAGLGTAVAERALAAAGLAAEAPESWVQVLLFVRRMRAAPARPLQRHQGLLRALWLPRRCTRTQHREAAAGGTGADAGALTRIFHE